MTRQICVILPVASDPEYRAKRSMIEAVSLECGFDTLFPMDAGFTFDIDAMLAKLRDSDFVIADISRERPSCYYELGLAEALHKTVFVIATVGTTIHQLANPESVVYYDGLPALREQLTEMLASRVADSEINEFRSRLR